MSARLLLEVALRLLGFWFLFDSIVNTVTSAAWYMAAAGAVGGFEAYYLSRLGAYLAVTLPLSLVLIRWAPNIAIRFYPVDLQISEPQARIGPGDLYHTACFALGAYLLVRGIEFTGQLAIAAVTSRGELSNMAVGAMIYTLSGLLLIFGAREIGQFFTNLRYDPDSIPQQQFSLKLLLIITVAVAVILVVIRALS
jgi:hypothetical protein